MARTPLYKTAETEMIARIGRGDWEVGRRLPNEFELAEEFGVSQGTMRRALISLEGMGYLNRKPGRGTLVAANAPVDSSSGSVAVPRLEAPSGQPLVLEPFRARAGTRGATAEEADLFGTARLATLERTLKWKGNRAAMDEITAPEASIPAFDEMAPDDFSELLEAHGLMPAKITTRVQAEMTDMAQSVALSVDRHTALLSLTFTAWNAADEAIARQVLKLAVEGARLSSD